MTGALQAHPGTREPDMVEQVDRQNRFTRKNPPEASQ